MRSSVGHNRRLWIGLGLVLAALVLAAVPVLAQEAPPPQAPSSPRPQQPAGGSQPAGQPANDSANGQAPAAPAGEQAAVDDQALNAWQSSWSEVGRSLFGLVDNRVQTHLEVALTARVQQQIRETFGALDTRVSEIVNQFQLYREGTDAAIAGLNDQIRQLQERLQAAEARAEEAQARAAALEGRTTKNEQDLRGLGIRNLIALAGAGLGIVLSLVIR